VNFAATTANVASVSNYLSGLQTTAGDTFAKNASGACVFNSTQAGDNVFNLTQSQLSAMAGTQVLFNSTVAGATDIINVQGGGTISLAGNMSFGYEGGMTDSKVLLNVGNATTVNLASNVSYDLSIMAPNATIATTGGNITGSVFAANLTGNAQLNDPNSGATFSGALPTIIVSASPAGGSVSPAPLPLLGTSPIGLLAMAWFGRRRIGRAVATLRAKAA
jgi:choice-of-anchor A domain-containing protein